MNDDVKWKKVQEIDCFWNLSIKMVSTVNRTDLLSEQLTRMILFRQLVRWLNFIDCSEHLGRFLFWLVLESQLNQVFQHFVVKVDCGDNSKAQFSFSHLTQQMCCFCFVVKDLATPTAFNRSPSLVWEFYHYRRELVRTKQPNKVCSIEFCNVNQCLFVFAGTFCFGWSWRKIREAWSTFQFDYTKCWWSSSNSWNKEFNWNAWFVCLFVCFQLNEYWICFVGNLFFVRCTKCSFVQENNSSPICESLRNRGFRFNFEEKKRVCKIQFEM